METKKIIKILAGTGASFCILVLAQLSPNASQVSTNLPRNLLEKQPVLLLVLIPKQETKDKSISGNKE